VITGDLVQVVVAKQVRARVTDVGHTHATARPQHGGQRRAHALQGRVLPDHLVQGRVRVADRRLEGTREVRAANVAVQRREGGDGDGARHLTVGVPAQAVGDREKARTGVRRVLAAFAEKTDVRSGRVPNCKCHVRSSTTVDIPVSEVKTASSAACRSMAAARTSGRMARSRLSTCLRSRPTVLVS
jgi:hypothetical protein